LIQDEAGKDGQSQYNRRSDDPCLWLHDWRTTRIKQWGFGRILGKSVAAVECNRRGSREPGRHGLFDRYCRQGEEQGHSVSKSVSKFVAFRFKDSYVYE
jgi:hypothetical protein